MDAISVIIPALNEERLIATTLAQLDRSIQSLPVSIRHSIQVIVVDNDSTDQTGTIVRDFNVIVIREPIRNIARARNAGGREAKGEMLLFLDADTLVPKDMMSRIFEISEDRKYIGGAVDIEQYPTSMLVRMYLRAWRLLGKVTAMAQGAAQFCRKSDFLALGGYDETIFMGEDVEFYWRMSRAARHDGRKIRYITDMKVTTSARRFDQWPLWRILVWTNPILVSLLRRRKSVWRGWYEDIPR